eukprot:TRINITY_DN61538_c0_g1_i1.p1 TRINITY_DN61538_c0_g1~~TRINITY_DN61538_c0_g1_i1.p1  ORF type:complete len:1688 (-),score=228.72 TRINITY_DN61538_c0_g1_i1:60-5123(-)
MHKWDRSVGLLLLQFGIHSRLGHCSEHLSVDSEHGNHQSIGHRRHLRRAVIAELDDRAVARLQGSHLMAEVAAHLEDQHRDEDTENSDVFDMDDVRPRESVVHVLGEDMSVGEARTAAGVASADGDAIRLRQSRIQLHRKRLRELQGKLVPDSDLSTPNSAFRVLKTDRAEEAFKQTLSMECQEAVEKLSSLVHFVMYKKASKRERLEHEELQLFADIKLSLMGNDVRPIVQHVLSIIDFNTALQAGSLWTQDDQERMLNMCYSKDPLDKLEEHIRADQLHALTQGDIVARTANPEEFRTDLGVALLQDASLSTSTSSSWGHLWPKGEVKFCFKHDVRPSARHAFWMAAIHAELQVPCINFDEIAFDNHSQKCREAPSLLVQSSAPGCWSDIGAGLVDETQNIQRVNLGMGCELMGHALHQIGHVLGMGHEQTRSDRDLYLKLQEVNADPSRFSSNFPKRENSQTNPDDPFDFFSIMLGSFRAFSTNGGATLIPKPNPLLQRFMGQRMALSQLDVEKLGSMYGCKANVAPFTMTKELSIRLLSGNGLVTDGSCMDSLRTNILIMNENGTGTTEMTCTELREHCLDFRYRVRVQTLCPVTCSLCIPVAVNFETQPTDTMTANKREDQQKEDGQQEEDGRKAWSRSNPYDNTSAQVDKGNALCPCISANFGSAETSGEVTLRIADSQVRYPLNTGGFCFPWDNSRYPGACETRDQIPGKGVSWCGKPWCFVDPCACDLPMRPTLSTIVQDKACLGKACYVSYLTCGGTHSERIIDDKAHCANGKNAFACTNSMGKCIWTGSRCMAADLASMCGISSVAPNDPIDDARGISETVGSEEKAIVATVSRAFRNDVENRSNGNSLCPCVSVDFGSAMLANSSGVMATTPGGSMIYPENVGSSCKAWDNGILPGKCENDTQTPGAGKGMCNSSWCYVNPCTCKLPQIPERSPYVLQATLNGFPAYRSFATCLDENSFRSASQGAHFCMNQTDKVSCSMLGSCQWVKERCFNTKIADMCVKQKTDPCDQYCPKSVCDAQNDLQRPECEKCSKCRQGLANSTGAADISTDKATGKKLAVMRRVKSGKGGMAELDSIDARRDKASEQSGPNSLTDIMSVRTGKQTPTDPSNEPPTLSETPTSPRNTSLSLAWTYNDTVSWTTRYPECGGSMQSPIDVSATRNYTGFDGPGALRIRMSFKPMMGLALRNNGRFLSVQGELSTVKLPKGKYDMRRMHFHCPSEHSIDTTFAACELQLIHQLRGSNGTADVAIFSVFFVPDSSGKTSKSSIAFLSQFGFGGAESMPTPGEEQAVAGFLDLSLLSEQFEGRFFHYKGSLTTPPCSEDVDWYLLLNLGFVRQAQIESIRNLFLGANRRPVQPAKDRQVLVDTLPRTGDANQQQMGSDLCPCVSPDGWNVDFSTGKGILINGSGLSGIAAEINGQGKKYPDGFGTTCEAWDNERFIGACENEEQSPGKGRGWCAGKWCFVNPCRCQIASPPRVSKHLPTATHNGKPLYFSYSTCEGKDFFAEKRDQTSCIRAKEQMTCAKLQMCTWTGTQCLDEVLNSICINVPTDDTEENAAATRPALDSDSSANGYVRCTDLSRDDTPHVTVRGKLANCTGLSIFCTGHPRSKVVREKCPVTCGVCEASAETTATSTSFGTSTSRAPWTLTEDAPEVQSQTWGCARRRRWGFCYTRRRRIQ